MQDLRAHREKFIADVAECELIASLAADPNKRQTFRKLAEDLRGMVRDLDRAIAAQTPDAA